MPDTSNDAAPVFPRRAFLAAGLSALLAGGGVALAMLGGLTQVDAASFGFSRGTAFANGQEDALRGFLSGALADERLHVSIIGHSGATGEAAANLELSAERAAKAETIALELGLPAARMTVSAVGGASPLPQQPGESDRAHQARLARVEVALQVRK